jgi:2,4-dienoyl-CoA reductase-like NADH-dependent reductase (Old Yellow Enzyme family)
MAFDFPYPKLAQFKSPTELRSRFAELGAEVPVDDTLLAAADGSPLAQSASFGSYTLGNRWCIHPMEGWDANVDGSPSAHTLRRWRNFGLSGAKLIWGGEAAAVQPDGRANPHQTLATEENRVGLAALLAELRAGHRSACGSLAGLVVGLQLTHSGRFCKPHDAQRFEPRFAYHHPLLDAKFNIDPHDRSIVWTDEQLESLIENYVRAARLAYEVGFQFVDIKACHGYLLHEFLSARSRPGRFGGDFAGRTRLLRTIVERVKREVPGLLIGVRLSAFDLVPFQTSRERGQPMPYADRLPYTFGFGVDAHDPLAIDLAEPLKLLGELRDIGVVAVNVTAGSPYYNPHIQRPAAFPPSDGYQPPEDPLLGVARQLQVARQCKLAVPDLLLVGTGYSYLQDYLPQVAQAVVRRNWVDIVGLGRMVLSYPELPLDTLAGRPMARKRICRTFSDCTTAPRAGMISGCFPLDPYYKALPAAAALKKLKQPEG